MAAKQPTDDAALREHLKSGVPAGVYLLYGEERYMMAYYVRRIVEMVTGGDDAGGFNCRRFEGSDPFSAVEEAAEALPLFAEHKCVIVRDPSMAAEAAERLTALVNGLPDTCVLVLHFDTVMPDTKKAAWRKLTEACAAHGYVQACDRKAEADAVRLLITGAVRRGCTISGTNASLLLQRVGNDLYLLFNELDKLAAIAGDGGEITREHILSASVQNLEASVFRLSDAILHGDYDRAMGILHVLWTHREEPVTVLAALSGAYTDLYRAKVLSADGVPLQTGIDTFGYRGREFRLRNAARDAARLTDAALAESIALLAETDMAMKSAPGDRRIMLEQTVVKLILLTRR